MKFEEQLGEMMDLLNRGLSLAMRLNPQPDRIIALRTAIGGLSDLSAYANNVTPSGGTESLPVVDYAAERRAANERQDEMRRRGLV
jgi:hypothetical protein